MKRRIARAPGERIFRSLRATFGFNSLVMGFLGFWEKSLWIGFVICLMCSLNFIWTMEYQRVLRAVRREYYGE